MFLFHFLFCSFCPCQAQVVYLAILSSGICLLYVHVYISLEMELAYKKKGGGGELPFPPHSVLLFSARVGLCAVFDMELRRELKASFG